ncbi:MAG: HdeD family acid-resistance protein [Syntrophobacteraceae bacterium]
MNIESNIRYRDIHELRHNLGWFIGMGIGLMVLGLFAVALPLVATFAVEVVVGILFIIGGIMLISHAFRWRGANRFATELLIGLLYAAFGLLLLAYPLRGAITLTLVLTVFFLTGGMFKIIQAFRIRPAARWGWTLCSGILSLILGVLLGAGLPGTAFWAVGLMVGIDLLFTGWSMLMISWAIRSSIGRGEIFCIWGTCFST